MGPLLVILTALQLSAPAPQGKSVLTAADVVSIRRMFDEQVVAALVLRADADGTLNLEDVETLATPFRITRYPQPTGDGVWVQLMSVRLEVLAAYRASLPEPGQRCRLEVPLVHRTSFVTLTERDGDRVRILSQFQVGRQLAEIAERLGM